MIKLFRLYQRNERCGVNPYDRSDRYEDSYVRFTDLHQHLLYSFALHPGIGPKVQQESNMPRARKMASKLSFRVDSRAGQLLSLR